MSARIAVKYAPAHVQTQKNRQPHHIDVAAGHIIQYNIHAQLQAHQPNLTEGRRFCMECSFLIYAAKVRIFLEISKFLGTYFVDNLLKNSK